MPKGIRQGGRPSKGARIQIVTRAPLPLAEAIHAEAARLDMAISDYVGNLLAAAHGFPPVAEQPGQGQMAMTA